MNSLFKAIDDFHNLICKADENPFPISKEEKDPQKQTSQEKPTPKQTEKRDRFHGAEGEERKQLIQQEATSKGYTLVPTKITPLNSNEVKNCLTNLIRKRFPKIEQELVEEFAYVLMAQIKLETGMKSAHNWNVGNIHALPHQQNEYWKGHVSAWDDPQFDKSGNKYVNVDWFWRAYLSLEDGLGDYYLFLEKRFPQAVEYAKQGDAYNFGMSLGKGGYYTANKNVYSNGLVKIKDSFKKKI